MDLFKASAGLVRSSIAFLAAIFVLLSLTLNVATFSVGTLSKVISSAIYTVTGVTTVASRYLIKEAEVTTLTTANKGLKAGQAALKAEQAALKAERVALKAAQIELRVGKRALEDSVEAITRRVSTRTVKVATADLSATFGQAIPWIGVAVVVAATSFDLKMSCETMKDMYELKIALKLESEPDADTDYVCGLEVPTTEEVWAAVKASPSAAWDAAATALTGLPDMMPELPDVDWTFWN